MNESRRKSTGGRAPERAVRKTDRSARRAPASAATWPDLPREDERPEPYRPELVARLEQQGGRVRVLGSADFVRSIEQEMKTTEAMMKRVGLEPN